MIDPQNPQADGLLLEQIPDDEPLAVGGGAPIPPSAPAGQPDSRPLVLFLPELLTERDAADVGGVPLPRAWSRIRAIFGGASRQDVESDGSYGLTEQIRDGAYLPPGLHVVTGQTGGGKSAFVVNLANAAADAEHPVLYVSLELDGIELAARLVGVDAELPWWRLALRRRTTSADRAVREAAVAAIRERAERIQVLAPEGAVSLARVRAEALDLWRRHRRTPLVVFDYLQAAAIAGGDGRRLPLREVVGAVTMELRRLSRALPEERLDDTPEAPSWPGCPVVVLSITARANVRGESGVQGLDGRNPDDLRKAELETLKSLPKEAGEIEATAVTAWVMALGEQGAHGVRPLTMRLAKNRMGPVGQWVPFAFDAATGRLTEDLDRYASATQLDAAAREAKQERASSRGTRGARRTSAIDLLTADE